MPRPIRILIDGYNLLFTCGLQGRTTDSRSLSRARQRLIREIRQYVGSNDLLAMICVVWDAAAGWGNDPAPEPTGPQVLFANDFPDADSMIEQMIAQAHAPRQLTVVSSDHRIRLAAKRRRCQSVDSETWYDDLLNGHIAPVAGETDSESPEAHASPPLLDPDEVQRWERDVAQMEQAGEEPARTAPSQTPPPTEPMEKDDVDLDFGLNDFEFDIEIDELEEDGPFDFL